MSHTNNHDTPRTNEVDKKARKFDGNDYWPGQMREHARQLERELAEMTQKFRDALAEIGKRNEANDSAMKTCAHLAAENERLKSEIQSLEYLDDEAKHGASEIQRQLDEIKAKHPNEKLSHTAPTTT